MVSLCHPWFTTTNLSYRFPIFETSATALCGTTGTYIQIPIYIYYTYIPKKKNREFWKTQCVQWKTTRGRSRTSSKAYVWTIFSWSVFAVPTHSLHKCKGNTRPELQHVATSIRSSSLEDRLTVFASESRTSFCICWLIWDKFGTHCQSDSKCAMVPSTRSKLSKEV